MAVSPCFHGYCSTTKDALILFEAVAQNRAPIVNRRPHDRERGSIVQSGNIFIYAEGHSGIKRWTDGIAWSPSRIMGNYLVYRELAKPFKPGEKKRATKRVGIKKDSRTDSDPNDMEDDGDESPVLPKAQRNTELDAETERRLVGSLVDSYGFKQDGLIKKTMAVTMLGYRYHLVSYYTISHAVTRTMTTPSMDPEFMHLRPHYELIHGQNFRVNVNENGDEIQGPNRDVGSSVVDCSSEDDPSTPDTRYTYAQFGPAVPENGYTDFSQRYHPPPQPFFEAGFDTTPSYDYHSNHDVQAIKDEPQPRGYFPDIPRSSFEWGPHPQFNNQSYDARIESPTGTLAAYGPGPSENAVPAMQPRMSAYNPLPNLSCGYTEPSHYASGSSWKTAHVPNQHLAGNENFAQYAGILQPNMADQKPHVHY